MALLMTIFSTGSFQVYLSPSPTPTSHKNTSHWGVGREGGGGGGLHTKLCTDWEASS